MSRRTPTPAQRQLWLDARARHYANTRSVTALAAMVVELEDDHDCSAEFDYHDEWPSDVADLQRAARNGAKP